MKVVWSEFAENELDKIFEYYRDRANIRVASNLIREIVLASENLRHCPYIGQKEIRLEKTKNSAQIFSS